MSSPASISKDWEMIKHPESQQTYDFFFYGTLLVPAILGRVLGHDCKDLSFQEAVLPGHTRHHVKGEDYPAVISFEQAKTLVTDETTMPQDTDSVRGTLVRGLSTRDVTLLDVFEGSEYIRKQVNVDTLTRPATVLGHPFDSSASDSNSDFEFPKRGSGTAWVYIWSDNLSRLEPDIWSFEQFVKDKAHVWTGMTTHEFDEVEKHRTATDDGGVSTALEESTIKGDGVLVGEKMEGYPDFGHGMLKYWKLRPGYTNLNHGSYGTPPNRVVDAMRTLSDEIEGCPDLFMRRTYFSKLDTVRAELARLINARLDEVVLVPNTSHGLCNVVTQLKWNPGDVIIVYASTYGATAQMMKFICDRYGADLEVVKVEVPCSHAKIVADTKAVFDKYNEPVNPDTQGGPQPIGKTPKQRVKAVVVDTIASVPGIIYPWQEVVKLCKEYGVYSVVDAAHSIGQHKIDAGLADPDFLVTNCHKWLMSHRGGAVLYVPLRNQHLIRSSFPTSHAYESTKYPTSGGHHPWEWAIQYQWTGTCDWTPYLTIVDAIDFRKDIGGEDRIMAYTHSLAHASLKLLGKRWKTTVVENEDPKDGVLTASMATVQLPHFPPGNDAVEKSLVLNYLFDELFAANIFASPFFYQGTWWIRISCQVWNELSDVVKLAEVVEGIVEHLRNGDHLKKAVAPEDLGAEDLAPALESP